MAIERVSGLDEQSEHVLSYVGSHELPDSVK